MHHRVGEEGEGGASIFCATLDNGEGKKEERAALSFLNECRPYSIGGGGGGGGRQFSVLWESSSVNSPRPSLAVGAEWTPFCSSVPFAFGRSQCNMNDGYDDDDVGKRRGARTS